MPLARYAKNQTGSNLIVLGWLLIIGGATLLGLKLLDLTDVDPRRIDAMQNWLRYVYLSGAAIGLGITLALAGAIISGINRVADQVRALHETTYYLAHPDEEPPPPDQPAHGKYPGPLPNGQRSDGTAASRQRNPFDVEPSYQNPPLKPPP